MTPKEFTHGLGIEPHRMMDFVGEPLTLGNIYKIEEAVRLCRIRAREEYIAAGKPVELPYVVTRYLHQAAGLRSLLIDNHDYETCGPGLGPTKVRRKSQDYLEASL